MDAVRLGVSLRALRLRLDLRQEEVAARFAATRSVVSRVERGQVDGVTLGRLAGHAAALGARLEVRIRWRGEQLDRLLDEAHAVLVEAVVRVLRTDDWDVAVEVSFAVFGERGSIDVLAWHRRSGSLLVVEVKSIVPDSQAMLAGIDRKARLAENLARDRGWEARTVSRLLVLGDSATTRRRIDRLAATYAVALPLRGHAVRAWLRAPSGALVGLLFLASARGARTSPAVTGRQRVRRRKRVVSARPTRNDGRVPASDEPSAG